MYLRNYGLAPWFWDLKDMMKSQGLDADWATKSPSTQIGKLLVDRIIKTQCHEQKIEEKFVFDEEKRKSYAWVSVGGINSHCRLADDVIRVAWF